MELGNVRNQWYISCKMLYNQNELNIRDMSSSQSNKFKLSLCPNGMKMAKNTKCIYLLFNNLSLNKCVSIFSLHLFHTIGEQSGSNTYFSIYIGILHNFPMVITIVILSENTWNIRDIQ